MISWRVKMAGAKDVSTPMSTTQYLHLLDGTTSMDNTEYRRIIESLQYLFLTRPNISFVVNKLFQFMHKPTIMSFLQLQVYFSLNISMFMISWNYSISSFVGWNNINGQYRV
jgi:hypothetical protein